MNSKEIEQKVNQLFENFSKEEFIFSLLLAYGTSKASITRLKKGDYNISKIEGEILYKRKVFFKEEEGDKLLSSIEAHSKEERILKHNPRFIILTDYETLVAKDLKIGKNLDIDIWALPKYFNFFLPLAGGEVYNTKNDNKADREAAYKMAELYDELRSANPEIYHSKESIHELNIFLSRLLFCFFAEDTGIFEEESIFTNTLVQHTEDNGSDTHIFLNDFFRRLNTMNGELFPEYLSRFPYVNGGLFKDFVKSPIFNFKARKRLIELGGLQWQEINPDIFGSMIQAVVLPEDRGDFGMHYTSVPNILKLIKPLFLDELYEKFENCKTILQLRKLILRISKIKFFDPACGSGNFLIITYKEIRKLEVEILKRIIAMEGDFLFVHSEIKLTQFYGIEIDDFAHEIAILSLWLAEHQMNQYFEYHLDGYTEHESIIPLKKSGTIVRDNAARVDWKDICPIEEDDEVYIIGNPPYLGKSLQNKAQKSDMDFVFYMFKNYKNLDYIAIWFFKGAKYIENHNAKLAFVSTNSICQGEQVALLWTKILNEDIEIGFAYQSFKWTNNAKGKAGVTVIILGLRNKSTEFKFLFDGNIKKETKNINSYLLDSNDIIIVGRNYSISGFSEMTSGSKISDDGNLLLDEKEKQDLILKKSETDRFIKKFIGANEFLNGNHRFCIYITNDIAKEAYEIQELVKRFEKVKTFRARSSKKATQKKSQTPHFFDEDKHQDTDYVFVPSTTSENREYIPLGFFDGSTIAGNSATIIYNAQPWLFGVIHSKMHMVWVRAVGGRLKTDYRYSAKLCYNTFPFPDISVKQKENLNLYVFAILDERSKYPEKTMAWLYDPKTMPLGLRKAHKELDEAVERCYRLQPFTSDTERLEYLFKLYEEMLKKDTLFAKQKKSRTKKNKI
jgi:hypothetical protein